MGKNHCKQVINIFLHSSCIEHCDLMEFLNLDIESHSNRAEKEPMHQTIKRSVNFPVGRLTKN